jgi:hypothetical protein
MYAPLANGGERAGVRLVDGDTLARMRRVSSATHEDATLLIPTRFALGFMKSTDNRRRAFGDRDSAILGASAFGHCGLGGSIGFADPEAGLAFGYTMNHAGLGVLLNDRGQSLVDAVYRCLGYGSNASGCWLRQQARVRRARACRATRRAKVRSASGSRRAHETPRYAPIHAARRGRSCARAPARRSGAARCRCRRAPRPRATSPAAA